MHMMNFVLGSVLVPICAFLAWALTGLVIWNTIAKLRDGIERIKHLHKIPCPNCQFFTNDYRLKCTVRPADALTEQAINCHDFDPRPFSI